MERETRKLQAKMTRLQNDSEEMETNYLKQNKELEEKMIKAIEVEKAAKREVEKAKKESEAAKEEAEAAREAAEAAETAKNNAEENHRRQIQELQQRQSNNDALSGFFQALTFGLLGVAVNRGRR